MLRIQTQLQRQHFSLNVDCALTQQVTAIFGASGSGKSTLLNVIAGIIPPDHGKIVLNERTLFDHEQRVNLPIYQRKIGLVFQDAKLFPHLNVRQNLAFGMPRQTTSANKQLNDIAALLEINHLLSQKPNQLSGGEKQRVALGRAILSDPELLMLDEPLASLDQRLKQQILPFLMRVTQEINIPMLYISHDPDEVAQVTDNVVHINNGELFAQN